jgi:WD40 repeat protein
VLSASLDGTVKKWDLTSERCITTFNASIFSPVHCLALSNDCSKLFCGHSNGSVVMWSMKKGVQAASFQSHTKLITCILVTNDDQAFISGSYDRTLKRWHLDQPHQAITCFLGHTLGIAGAALSADNSRVYSCGT